MKKPGLLVVLVCNIPDVDAQFSLTLLNPSPPAGQLPCRRFLLAKNRET